MMPVSVAGSPEYVNGVLQQLFAGHGVEATTDSGRVTFPAHPGMWAEGELFDFGTGILQLDVRLGGFDGERTLVESVCGFGPDLNAQASFAVQSFANASFHVLLPAFFGRPPCHGTEREIWQIGGPRAVFSGLITTVVGYPPPKADGMPDIDFFPAFVKRLEHCSLSPGTHWVRIYQMRHAGQSLSNEVLLDNDPWSEMQDFLAGLTWPVADNPYDVRVFLVIQDAV